MNGIDLTLNEVVLLNAGLLRERQFIARQRSLTEQRLANGEGDAAVLVRLANFEECDLAAIDRLFIKLGAA